MPRCGIAALFRLSASLRQAIHPDTREIAKVGTQARLCFEHASVPGYSPAGMMLATTRPRIFDWKLSSEKVRTYGIPSCVSETQFAGSTLTVGGPCSKGSYPANLTASESVIRSPTDNKVVISVWTPCERMSRQAHGRRIEWTNGHQCRTPTRKSNAGQLAVSSPLYRRFC